MPELLQDDVQIEAPPGPGWKLLSTPEADQETPPGPGWKLLSQQVGDFTVPVSSGAFTPNRSVPLTDEQLAAQPPVKAVVAPLTSDAERQKEPMLQFARQRLGEAWFPNLKASAIGLGASVAAPAARLVGATGTADKINRFSEAYQQAIAEQDPGGYVPPIVKRGLRGAAQTVPTMMLAGAAGGPYAPIAVATWQEADRAVTKGRDAGLNGTELMKYVAVQGLIEGVPDAVMQRVGLGGLESVVGQAGKVAVAKGIMGGLNRAGISTLQEIPVEVVTEIGHNIADAVSGVDPDSASPDRLMQTVLDTTVQTIITAGVVTSPSVIQSALSELPDAPARKQFEKAGGPKVTSAKERQAFVEAARKAVSETEVKPTAQQPDSVPPATVEQPVQTEQPAVEPEPQASTPEPVESTPVTPAIAPPLNATDLTQEYDTLVANMVASGMSPGEATIKALAEIAARRNPAEQPQTPVAEEAQPAAQVEPSQAAEAPPAAEATPPPAPPVANRTPEQDALESRLRAVPALAKASVTVHDGSTATIDAGDGVQVPIEIHTPEELAKIAAEPERISDAHMEASRKAAAAVGRTGPLQVVGMFDPKTGTLHLPSDFKPEHASHEIVHAMRRLKMITDAEVAEFGTEEDIAYGYQDWVKNGRVTTSTVFQRIWDFVAGMVGNKAAKQRGIFQSINDRLAKETPAAAQPASNAESVEPEPTLADQPAAESAPPEAKPVYGEIAQSPEVQELARAAERILGGMRAGVKAVNRERVEAVNGVLVDLAADGVFDPDNGKSDGDRIGAIINAAKVAAREKKRVKTTPGADPAQVAARKAEAPTETEQAIEAAKAIRQQAMAQLPEDLQAALNARYPKGPDAKVQSYPKVAKSLGMKPTTTRQRVLEAEKRLGAIMDEMLRKPEPAATAIGEIAAKTGEPQGAFFFRNTSPGGNGIPPSPGAQPGATFTLSTKPDLTFAVDGDRVVGFRDGKPIGQQPREDFGDKFFNEVDPKQHPTVTFDYSGVRKAETPPPDSAKVTGVRTTSTPAQSPAARQGPPSPLASRIRKAAGKTEAERVKAEAAEVNVAASEPLAEVVKPTHAEKAAEALGRLKAAFGMLGESRGPSLSTVIPGLGPKQIQAIVDIIKNAGEYGYHTVADVIQAIKATVADKWRDEWEPFLRKTWAEEHGSEDAVVGRVETEQDATTEQAAKAESSEPPAENQKPSETQDEPNAKTPAAEPNDVVSIKNRIVDDLRNDRGAQPLPGLQKESQAQWLQAAADRIQQQPSWTQSLIDELGQNPRQLSPIEVAGLQIAYRRLVTEHMSASNAVEDAWNAGDQNAIAEHTPRLQALEKELDVFEDAVRAAGREWGRAGVARQIELAKDESLAGLRRRARSKQDGRPLSPEQEAEIRRLHAELESAKKQLAEYEQSKLTSNIQDQINGVRTRKRSKVKAWRKNAAPIPEPGDAAGYGNYARDLLREIVESGITDTEKVIDAVHARLMAEVDSGITRIETMHAISGYGDFKPLSTDAIDVEMRRIRGETQALSKLEDIKQGKVPLKSGREQRQPGDVERRLLQQVREGLKKAGLLVADPARQLRTATLAAERAMTNWLKDRYQEIQTREKIVKTKQPVDMTERLQALQEEKARVKEIYDVAFPKQPLTPEQRIHLLDRALDRAIAGLQKDLQDGKIGPKPKADRISTPELEAKRLILEALKAQREELRANDPQYQADLDAKQLATYKRMQAKRLADLTMLYAETQRTQAIQPKKEPRRTKLDRETTLKKMDVDKVRAKLNALNEAIRRKNQNLGQWIAEGLSEITSHLPRALQTGLEMSVVARQGVFYTYSHPVMASYAFVDAMGAVLSERMAFESGERITERENAKNGDYATAKLQITEQSGPLSATEEMFQSGIIRWLNESESTWLLPLRLLAKAYMATERGFRTFSNTMKADLYDIFKRDTESARNWFSEHGIETKTWNAEDAKTVGISANIFSGRGTGIQGRSWSDSLWYAQRWVWSRIQAEFVLPFQLATPKFIGQWNGDMSMRIAHAKLYSRALLGMATYMAAKYWLYYLLADDDKHKPKIEWDPRSTDFMKMKVGDTRIDTLGGLQQPVVLAARLLTGQTKLANGRIESISGPSVKFGRDDAAGTIFRAVRTKLGPGPSGLVDWFAGRDVVGNEVTKWDIIRSRMLPLTWADIAKTEKELGWKQGSLAALEAFLGASVSTYKPKPWKPSKLRKTKPIFPTK